MKKPKLLDSVGLRIWLGSKCFAQDGGKSVRVSQDRLIKGPCITAELEAIRFVKEHTSIPIPKLYCVHTRSDGIYLEMERVAGTNLQLAWIENQISLEEKAFIMQELGKFVDQLRQLRPPKDGAVGSALLGKFRDGRIGSRMLEPFENHAEFHSFLRGHLLLEHCTKTFGAEVTNCHTRSYTSKFTHADLIPRNVIVKSGKIAAIVDWETAGWYPEYWEYTKAHYSPLNMPEYYDQLHNVLESYTEELTAERALWRGYGEPADEPVTLNGQV